MRILGLDTSGKTASVAVLDTEQQLLLGEHTIYTSRTHSQVILPICKALLEECRLTVQDIDCMAVAVGPGSYTGLRIGIAAVQGMAMANNTACVGVSTLEAMASRICYSPMVLAVMHARENLFYTALFSYIFMDHEPERIERVTPDQLLTVTEIAELLDRHKTQEWGVTLVGDGTEELWKQYYALDKTKTLRIAPANLRQQSAAGVCQCAVYDACHHPGTPADLTASYLQAVQIQKKKTDR